MRRGKKNSAIEQMRQRLETLTVQMQVFHLDPQWNIFQEICEYPKLRSEQSQVYDLWRLACLVTYGKWWAETYESAAKLPELDKEVRLDNIEKFTKQEQELLVELDTHPSATRLDRVWYLFFATGDYKYLKTGFETAGNQNAKLALREDAMQMFETIRDTYQGKIADAKAKRPNYFEDHEMKCTREAPRNWERLDEEILGKTKELDEAVGDAVTDAEIDAALADMKKYEFVTHNEAEMTPEERAHQRKVDHGVEVFNRVLRRINESETKKDILK